MASGVPQDKLVIGKPAKNQVDAKSGYIDSQTLAGCVSQAKKKGWSKLILCLVIIVADRYRLQTEV